MDKVRLLGESD